MSKRGFCLLEGEASGQNVFSSSPYLLIIFLLLEAEASSQSVFSLSPQLITPHHLPLLEAEASSHIIFLTSTFAYYFLDLRKLK